MLDCEVRDLFRNASTGKTLAPKTVLEYHRLISTILHQAEKEMILMYNPAARATPPKAKAPTPDYYQPDQMDEILNALENAPLLWKTITYIMIDSGCRRGEALTILNATFWNFHPKVLFRTQNQFRPKSWKNTVHHWRKPQINPKS